MIARDNDGSDGQGQLLITDTPPLVRDSADPVLSSLGAAREEYLHSRERWMQQLADLRQAEAEAQRAVEAERQAAAELRLAHEQLDRERRRAERHKERARRLAEGLKSIHRALFEGNVFTLILRACLNITGASRGLYVTAWGQDELRVRAAVDVDGYPQAPPSPFIRSLCRKVLDDQQTFLCNGPECFADLPEPGRPVEHFRNCVVAPVVLLKNLNGVVIIADKIDGDFDDADAEVVLSVGDQASVAVENQRLQRELTGAYFAIVGVLADAVEAKDPYTQGHCELVARYARRTAARLGLSDAERSIVCYGGLLHDIGKIGISDGVLNKPGKLLPEEWDLMRSHVRVGRDLLARVPVLGSVSDVVLHHHERYDGHGYPEGLEGEAISLPARIVCVADAYCAMISKRSYKESATDAEARAELLRCKGTHFDPAVVDAFLAVLDAPEDEEELPERCGLLPGEGDGDDFHLLLHRPSEHKA